MISWDNRHTRENVGPEAKLMTTSTVESKRENGKTGDREYICARSIGHERRISCTPYALYAGEEMSDWIKARAVCKPPKLLGNFDHSGTRVWKSTIFESYHRKGSMIRPATRILNWKLEVPIPWIAHMYLHDSTGVLLSDSPNKYCSNQESRRKAPLQYMYYCWATITGAASPYCLHRVDHLPNTVR